MADNKDEPKGSKNDGEPMGVLSTVDERDDTSVTTESAGSTTRDHRNSGAGLTPLSTQAVRDRATDVAFGERDPDMREVQSECVFSS